MNDDLLQTGHDVLHIELEEKQLRVIHDSLNAVCRTSSSVRGGLNLMRA
jgi:hypothetical protein